ncbi:MAG TPA: AMP-binding protein, partial [Casimicrobiaceae bacterium]
MAISTIFRYAHETPDKTAVVHNDVACSYAQLAGRIEACRRHFARQDLPVGTVAVIDVECLLDAWVFGFALRSLGLTTCALRGPEAPGDLRVGTIGCVVTAAADNRPAPENTFGELPWRSVCVPSDLGLADVPIGPPEWHPAIAQPGGHIMMTSGTTGAYKRVMRSGEMETRTLPLHAEIYGMSERSVVYVSNFPLWTAGGYGWPLIAWHAGGTVIIHQGPDLHGPLLRHDITHIFATPGTLPSLLRASNGTLRRNDASRLFVTGGALSQATLAAAKRDLT